MAAGAWKGMAAVTFRQNRGGRKGGGERKAEIVATYVIASQPVHNFCSKLLLTTFVDIFVPKFCLKLIFKT